MKSELIGVVAALAAALCWTLASSLWRRLPTSLGPGQLNLLKHLVALALQLPLLLALVAFGAPGAGGTVRAAANTASGLTRNVAPAGTRAALSPLSPLSATAAGPSPSHRVKPCQKSNKARSVTNPRLYVCSATGPSPAALDPAYACAASTRRPHTSISARAASTE